jgi:methionyl-tRNA synthetase
VNKDLADVLGNFVSRVTKFCRSKFGEVVPSGGEYGQREQNLIDNLQLRLDAYQNHMEAVDVRKSAAELRAIWVLGNEYLQSAEPWAIFKDDPNAAAATVRMSLNLIALYGQLSEPFIPDASEILQSAMGQNRPPWPESITDTLEQLKAGDIFTVPDNLFTKITDEQRLTWNEKFSGLRD